MNESYKCHLCDASMTIVAGATKHLYECARHSCKSRAVIVAKGSSDGAVFRYNIGVAKRFPSTSREEPTRPKGVASSALKNGAAEMIASMPGGLARAVSDVLAGGQTTAIDIVNSIVPEGVRIVDDGPGCIKIEDSDDKPTNT